MSGQGSDIRGSGAEKQEPSIFLLFSSQGGAGAHSALSRRAATEAAQDGSELLGVEVHLRSQQAEAAAVAEAPAKEQKSAGLFLKAGRLCRSPRAWAERLREATSCPRQWRSCGVPP